jgi:hypothetical protein
MKSFSLIVCAALILSASILTACVTSDAEWEAHYRQVCEKRAVQAWEDRKPTEAEIQHCIELERSGIGADYKLHENEGDIFDIFRH